MRAASAAGGIRTHYVIDERRTTLCGKRVTAVHENVPGYGAKADCHSCQVAAGERRRGSAK